ncbi:GATOR complex protein DEPDC5-like isoform X1 [Patiria miniata]|uniref:DEP domain-containing protein n=1 Tax=Patiria miniata TaxID=46514 RepID=A0A914A1B3_PATMI|nr:GATOR complex protein DEPDC5-like isoform X1 [Patiria miniata]
MKLCKLWVHQKGFSEDELVINPKEFPHVRIGDILEIFHPDEDSSHLLLQVKSLQTDLQQKGKDIISVDQTIASLFQLRAYKDVEVHPVPSTQDVCLDLVELVFKDQYISRSDMWRLKNSLIGSCAYLSKKVEYSGIRAQVNELWARGEKVMCGAVSEDTRVAFRSATAMVYMFIQMSSEMWEFDANGDLLWEKSVNGFVAELFNHWKEKNTVNEVTIFLFSRIYYYADTLDQFPEDLRACLHVDYKGRTYEDFYRVIVQNERLDDWTPLLVTLKSHCIQYGQQLQSHYIQGSPQEGRQRPSGYISNAAEGNFLEALNLTLNVFDKHYINRNFDRTGQVVVIVTPGAGVFEVDRELYKITKQRMIDNGIGSDLVCMAEQPLHAVPLLRFQSTSTHPSVRDYSIPHWLNYSFYTAQGQREKCHIYSSFTPRIKLAEKKESADSTPSSIPHLPPLPEDKNMSHFKQSHQDEDYMFEEYDAEVFKVPSYASPKPRTPFSIRPSKSTHNAAQKPRSKEESPCQPSKKLKESKVTGIVTFNTEPTDSHNHPLVSQSTSSTAIPIPERPNLVAPSVSVTAAARLLQETSISRSVGDAHITEHRSSNTPVNFTDVIVGSANAIHNLASGSPNHQFVYRTLINPFAPSTMAIRLTSNRRRWTHTFPPGPSGETMQPHHRRWTTSEGDTDMHPSCTPAGLSESISAPANHPASPRQLSPISRLLPSPSRHGPAPPRLAPPAVSGIPKSGSASSLGSEGSGSGNPAQHIIASRPTITHRQSGNLPDTGARYDGGSRTSPASDSFRTLMRSTSGVWGVTGEQEWTPFIQTGMDWKSLTATACFPITTDYYPDSLTVEKQFMENNYELLADDHDEAAGGQRQTGEGVFQEIISQRLMQGFQMVVVPKSFLSIVQGRRSKDILVTDPNKHEYVLSIGRIFHKLVLHPHQRAISVTVYKPRHLTISRPVYYTYQLWSAHNSGYQPSSVNFQPYMLENFNWNYLDNYVSSKGIDFGPMESLKLWRSRFLLLPTVCSKKKRILEDPAAHLDIFPEVDNQEEAHQQTEGFIKFLETLNRLRRHHSGGRRSKAGSFSVNLGSVKSAELRRSSLASVHGHSRKSSDGSLKAMISAMASLTPSRQAVTSTLPSSNAPTQGPGVLAESSTSPRSLKEEGEDGELDTEGEWEDRSKLTLCTPLWEIAKAMREQQGGLLFLPSDQRKIPSNCFMASEAVHWIMSTLQGDVTQEEAVEILQNMTEEGLICHASGNPSHPFWNGFYLYYIIKEETQIRDKSRKSPSRQSSTSSGHHSHAYSKINDNFHNEWFEVAVCSPSAPPSDIPQFLLPVLPRPVSPATTIMTSFVETIHGTSMDSDEEAQEIKSEVVKPASLKSLLYDSYTAKTDRVEWCHINYNGCFCADEAWGFQVEWLVSTPSLLVEVLQGWARKAVQCGFHLVPAPMDAFNQCPHFNNPLSCPRFIPLDIQCLQAGTGQRLFEHIDPSSQERRVHLLQETILKRFGFIKASEPFPLSPITSQHSIKDQIQYVHMTGMALILIVPPTNQDTTFWDDPLPIYGASTSGNSPTDQGARTYVKTEPDQKGLPMQDRASNLVAEVGFLWVPNYLLTKRWRTSSSGDEKFLERLLQDFTSFCENCDNRLSEFWEKSKKACHSATQQ